ncbi:L-serine ammonia-lyase, iron-sulfur-dependent, subunit alpha [Fenollaria sporofastidiosus]|uniref:L-serine ammonia-lyase, iron-sulfur-dependent, subunit alpha n=1 Tax=Fenollaria sporofastidiosus TaxID=2811778 RepID=UPI001C005F5F|nr:L-serine ammonia-lyase, iron-sulfur-dependent, subunit alpha [Fenollaria sporofastidiosus]
MYTNAQSMIDACEEQNKKLYELQIEQEMESGELTKDDIYEYLRKTYEIMKKSAKAGLETPIMSMSGMTGKNAFKVNEYANIGNPVSGSLITKAMARALSTSEVNASMGRIVAAPTAGASGILPATLLTMQEEFGYSDEEIYNALLTASAVGELIAVNATISGAEGGCQAECGAAAAMAAAAIIELRGGTIENVFTAASFALKNIMGLVCDPVCGLVEYPCNLRNASGVVNAIISADLALAGVEALIPFDETVGAMGNVGKELPVSLKETAIGGVAGTETAQRLYDEFLNK